MTVESWVETERRLRVFIASELDGGGLPDGDPLAAGIIDSLGIAQLLDYIEETLGVELDDEEIVQENFENISSLARLVDSKC